MHFKRLLSILLLALITSPFCTAQETQPYAELLNSNRGFAFKLFNATVAKEPEKNVLLCPTSLSQDFALLQNGADAKAREQILSVFGFDNLSAAEINRQTAALRRTLIYDPQPKASSIPHRKREVEPPPICCAAPREHLKLAGSVWAVPQVKFRSQFLEINMKFYSFHLASVSNKGQAATDAVNTWVARQTGGLLTNALDSWAADDFLVVDTTWFKGTWQRPFDVTQTHPGDFTLASGQRKRVPMMAQGGHFSYLRGPKFQAVLLPYGHAVMYVFLPDLDSSLKEFEQSLTSENWAEWLSQISDREGYLELPRFRSDYQEYLTETLREFGLGRLFDSSASFRQLVDNPEGARLTRVLQAVSIEVDEKGTEAVSATFTGGVIGGVSSGPRPEPFRMIVDHPFFFAICDKQTNSVLYMGAVNEPLSLP